MYKKYINSVETEKKIGQSIKLPNYTLLNDTNSTVFYKKKRALLFSCELGKATATRIFTLLLTFFEDIMR